MVAASNDGRAQMYVLNEETQLACCFFLFCTSVYKFGGDAIASYFDARANAILGCVHRASSIAPIHWQ